MNTEIYEEIMRRYDRIRTINEQKRVDGIQKAYEKCPELKKADDEKRELGTSFLKKLVEKPSAREELKKEFSDKSGALDKKRFELMKLCGIPENYDSPVYFCSVCKDTGFKDNERCECFDKILSDVYYNASNIQKVIQKENFSTFRYEIFSDTEVDGISPREKIRQIVGGCIAAIEAIAEKPMNLFFYGGTGVGKTFMCNCIAKELLDRQINVVYTMAYELTEDLVNAHFNADDTDAADKKRLCYGCDVLIIDDLGTETGNSVSNTELFGLINSRLINEKSTIISTNLLLSDLKNRYTERISSRILGKYDLNKFIGDDLRVYGSVR